MKIKVELNEKEVNVVNQFNTKVYGENTSIATDSAAEAFTEKYTKLDNGGMQYDMSINDDFVCEVISRLSEISVLVKKICDVCIHHIKELKTNWESKLRPEPEYTYAITTYDSHKNKLDTIICNTDDELKSNIKFIQKTDDSILRIENVRTHTVIDVNNYCHEVNTIE